MRKSIAHLDQAKQPAWPLTWALCVKMKPIEAIKSIPLMVFILIMLPATLISKLFEKSIVRNHEEVEGILKEMLSGKEYDENWDDFLSIPIKNKKLNKIREQVEIIWEYDDFQTKNNNDKYVLNDKGLTDLKEILSKLNT